MTVALLRSAADDLLSAALVPGALRPDFQPIVDLETGQVVALEALARWPGIPGADPASVFSAAAQTGATAELDWSCRIAATRLALEDRMDPNIALFINVESATLGLEVPAAYRELIERARGRLRIVLELTERELMRDPAELLKLVRWARAEGWGIAMDDVGADTASLALLSFVAPDVVKLDLSLVQGHYRPDQARTVLGIAAFVEESGAVLVAEGIENEQHLERARALGARYGQGWLLGRPGPITAPTRVGPLPPSLRFGPVDATPFELVREAPQLRRGRKQLLLDMTRALEGRAGAPDEAAVLLSAFQYAENFTPGTAQRYQRLAARLPLVAALGQGLSSCPAPGVRGTDLSAGDPLIGEWTVVVIGPHYAGALIARDCGDDGPDRDRRFDFVLTQERETVLRAGRSLLHRITSDRSPTGRQ